MYKKAIFTFLTFIFAGMVAFGQPTGNDTRVLSTKIADLLAKFPAENKDQLRKNMQLMSDIDKKGLLEMAGMLTSPGEGDNTALEYALSSFSAYVIQPGMEKERRAAVDVFCNALGSAKHDQNRDFLIRQLQLIGKDDAVPCVQQYLSSEYLAGPAARALAQINTPAAEKALLPALGSLTGKPLMSVVEALGYSRYTPAVPAIQAMVKTGSDDVNRIGLYALAHIADPASAVILATKAKEAKFTFNNSTATAAYILYLQELNAAGNKTLAARLAGQLVTDANASKQLQTRIAALKLLVDINGAKSMPNLYRAMKDNNIQYRAAALAFAEPLQNSYHNRQWVGVIPQVSPAAQAQIISYLGNTRDTGLYARLQQYLDDANKEVRLAAIHTTAKLGQEKAIPGLIERLKKADTSEAAQVKRSLQVIKSDNIAPFLVKDFETLPPAGKAVVLQILAARRPDNISDFTFSQVASEDTLVHMTALRALPALVQAADLPKVFPLLNNAKANEVAYFQEAIIAASASVQDTAARTKLITDEMTKATPEKRYLFLDVLTAIGGAQALHAVNDAYRNGDAQTKTAAIRALSKASDLPAASLLLGIAKDSLNPSYAGEAVNAYISVIERSAFTEDQKVLMLDEAMRLSTGNEQKKRVLREASRNRTFLSLLFAGRYLDNPALQADAAMAVMNIALANPAFSGKTVRDLLTRAEPLIKGPDSDYQRKAILKFLADMPPGAGFVPLFNGRDLSGWKGLVQDPVKRSKMTPQALAKEQTEADRKMKEGWIVRDGLLVFTGHGENLVTEKKYGDIEMYVDWKITPEGDAGIYLRGTPQVQIWDTSRHDVGAQVGSGGLYNNQKNPSKPLVVADNPIGEWNTFHIIMKGDKVTVHLNGKLVTDNVTLENYWDRNVPLFAREQIELQAHGTYVAYRNLYVKELATTEPYVLTEEEKKENYQVLFDGSNIDQWTGNKKDYVVANNELVIKPTEGGGGNLFTAKEFADFVFRFEFQLTPGANNGLGIRAPLEGDAAYQGMEIQILDNDADIYRNLKPYQYHGSVYGVIAAKRGFLKPVGEWNYQEVIVKGSKVKVILNNEVILDGDIKEATANGGPVDHQKHPGLERTSGHIGFLGHGSLVKFRNIRIKEL